MVMACNMPYTGLIMEGCMGQDTLAQRLQAVGKQIADI